MYEVKVSELMTSHPHVCYPESSLSECASAMWEADCGVLPVVDREGKAIGMLTDRDICMASMFNDRHPSEIHVSDVHLNPPYTCHADDSLAYALDVMQHAQVRRLPVVDDNDSVQGIISMNDLILAATPRAGKNGVGQSAVMKGLQEISMHRDLPSVRSEENAEEPALSEDHA